MTASIDAISNSPLGRFEKGAPGAAVAVDDVGALGWNVVRGDLPVPLLTLRDAVFAYNLRSMREFVAANGIVIAPHGKTPMAPKLFEEYRTIGGAWGVSAATVQQAAVCAASGAPHVLIPNQVVGRANVAALASLRAAHPECGFPTFADSPEAVEQLVRFGASLLADGDRFEILVEVGGAGARTGARTAEQVDAVIAAAKAHASAIRVVGVGCYEGAIHGSTPEETLRAIDAYLAFAVETFNRTAAAGLFAGLDKAILTGGGSSWFDRVTAVFTGAKLDHPARVVLRCGAYPFMDHRAYRRSMAAMDARGGLPGMPPGKASALAAFPPSLELWAAVQSVRDPGRAILTMGRRDLPYDQGNPIPLRRYRDGGLIESLPEDEAENPFRITGVDDQHAYLTFPEDADVRVGDLMAFGISHPCTAFEKWRVVFRVDPEFNVTGAVRTFF